MAPPKYEDLGKAARDLFSKGFSELLLNLKYLLISFVMALLVVNSVCDTNLHRRSRG